MKTKQIHSEKKRPERRCVGCGGRFEKQTLIRVVRAPDGSISLDFKGKKSGRGAYLCRNVKCLRSARKGDRLGQQLSTPIGDDVYARLEEEMTTGGGDD